MFFKFLKVFCSMMIYSTWPHYLLKVLLYTCFLVLHFLNSRLRTNEYIPYYFLCLVGDNHRQQRRQIYRNQCNCKPHKKLRGSLGICCAFWKFREYDLNQSYPNFRGPQNYNWHLGYIKNSGVAKILLYIELSFSLIPL